MRALLASFALLALAVAGCSGSGTAPDGDGGMDGAGGAAGSVSQSMTGGSGASAMAPTSAEVMAMNNQFTPREVTVKVGGSVRWVTHDPAAPHNVVSDSPGNEFRSPDMDAALPLHEREFTHAFGAVGTVDYLCEYHSGMAGRVFVVE